MSRAQKRAGFGSLSGSANPRITLGSEKPLTPNEGDLHFDRVRGETSEYNGSAWVTYQGLVVSTTPPTNKNVLWLDIS